MTPSPLTLNEDLEIWQSVQGPWINSYDTPIFVHGNSVSYGDSDAPDPILIKPASWSKYLEMFASSKRPKVSPNNWIKLSDPIKYGQATKHLEDARKPMNKDERKLWYGFWAADIHQGGQEILWSNQQGPPETIVWRRPPDLKKGITKNSAKKIQEKYLSLEETLVNAYSERELGVLEQYFHDPVMPIDTRRPALYKHGFSALSAYTGIFDDDTVSKHFKQREGQLKKIPAGRLYFAKADSKERRIEGADLVHGCLPEINREHIDEILKVYSIVSRRKTHTSFVDGEYHAVCLVIQNKLEEDETDEPAAKRVKLSKPLKKKGGNPEVNPESAVEPLKTDVTIGIAVYRVVSRWGFGEIPLFCVSADYQGMGVGELLMTSVQKFVLAAGGTNIILCASHSAIPFFERHHFTQAVDDVTKLVTLARMQRYDNAETMCAWPAQRDIMQPFINPEVLARSQFLDDFIGQDYSVPDEDAHKSFHDQSRDLRFLLPCFLRNAFSVVVRGDVVSKKGHYLKIRCRNYDITVPHKGHQEEEWVCVGSARLYFQRSWFLISRLASPFSNEDPKSIPTRPRRPRVKKNRV